MQSTKRTFESGKKETLNSTGKLRVNTVLKESHNLISNQRTYPLFSPLQTEPPTKEKSVNQQVLEMRQLMLAFLQASEIKILHQLESRS